VRHVSDRVVVMYLGETCEIGSSDELFDSPKHPYTEALIAANPGLDDERSQVRLHGDIPSPANPPQGCRFHTRCPRATPECGWDVDDAVRTLQRAEVLDGLVRLERTSPFSAVLEFEDGGQAHAAHETLKSPPTPPAMREAMTELESAEAQLQIGFVPVDGVDLVEIEDGRETACILFTKDRKERA
jgi:oligopeptide/dipeptide ABC transporter ATP-binding protein